MRPDHISNRQLFEIGARNVPRRNSITEALISGRRATVRSSGNGRSEAGLDEGRFPHILRASQTTATPVVEAFPAQRRERRLRVRLWEVLLGIEYAWEEANG
jgi:hypothetical protein